MTEQERMQILVAALQELTKSHDGDCGEYPAWAHDRPVDEENCECFNKTARTALRKAGFEVPA